MSLFASRGFGKPGGIWTEEYDKIVERKGDTEGLIYRVISMPSFMPSNISYTQYATCFSHNLHRYLENGWKDEGYESINEKECIDWISTKPDCSLEIVLKNNPGLEERALASSRPATSEQKYEQEMRRGKYS